MLIKFRELITYKNMIISFTHSEVRNRYKGSVLGVIWALLNPLFLLIIYGFVFSLIMRVQIENYFLFLFTGLLPWVFFRSSILTSANSVVGNASLVKKVYFPREILPITSVLSNLVNFLISLLVLFPALFIFGDGISVYVLLLPIIICIQVTLTIGLSLFFSAITVYLRDVRLILEVSMMALFYLTPIIYQVDMVPERFRSLMNINPLKPIIEAYQDILFYQIAPDYSNLVVVFLVSLMLLVVSFNIFNKLNRYFAEKI